MTTHGPSNTFGPIALADQIEQMSILISQSDPPAQLELPYELAAGLREAIFTKDMMGFIIGRTWMYEPVTQLVSTRHTSVRPEAQSVLKLRYTADGIKISMVTNELEGLASPIQLQDIDHAIDLMGKINTMISHKEEVKQISFQIVDLVSEEA